MCSTTCLNTPAEKEITNQLRNQLLLHWFHCCHNTLFTLTHTHPTHTDTHIFKTESLWSLPWLPLLRNHLKLTSECVFMCVYLFRSCAGFTVLRVNHHPPNILHTLISYLNTNGRYHICSKTTAKQDPLFSPHLRIPSLSPPPKKSFTFSGFEELCLPPTCLPTNITNVGCRRARHRPPGTQEDLSQISFQAQLWWKLLFVCLHSADNFKLCCSIKMDWRRKKNKKKNHLKLRIEIIRENNIITHWLKS